MPVVYLNDVSKRFGNVNAITDVNLEVKDGEYLCVLGPTGSGKTTLLRLIAGLIHSDKGKINIDNKDVSDVPPEERGVAYLPQQYALFPHLDVLANVAFGPTARGVSENEALNRAKKALETVKLDHRASASPSELSGGMQQRVALARALASGAKLLLLDEPLGALDARLRVELRYYLKNLSRREGLTAIHVTHDQREAIIVADRIAVLRMGRIEQIGTPFHIYQRPDNLFVASFVGETNFFEGTIKKTDPLETIVELRDGLRVSVEEKSYLCEEKVVLAVKQELTSIKTDIEESVNSLPGEIRGVRFLGDFVKIEVRLVNGIEVGAKVPITQINNYPKLGGKVVISFRSRDATVFCTPTKGLAKEIEVV